MVVGDVVAATVGGADAVVATATVDDGASGVDTITTLVFDTRASDAHPTTVTRATTGNQTKRLTRGEFIALVEHTDHRVVGRHASSFSMLDVCNPGLAHHTER